MTSSLAAGLGACRRRHAGLPALAKVAQLSPCYTAAGSDLLLSKGMFGGSSDAEARST
jgi:hypothetical protein